MFFLLAIKSPKTSLKVLGHPSKNHKGQDLARKTTPKLLLFHHPLTSGARGLGSSCYSGY